MTERETGPKAAVRGVVEEAKGKAKEVAGVVADDDDLQREGRAQREKAGAEREVARHEAAADKARSEAAMHEAEQRRAQ